MRRIFLWAFQNRETGAVTIAQFPNVALWIVIFAWVARWLFHPDGRMGAILSIAVTGGLLVWAFDEIVRGVNPWRRCLGAATLCYALVSLRFA